MKFIRSAILNILSYIYLSTKLQNKEMIKLVFFGVNLKNIFFLKKKRKNNGSQKTKREDILL
jgi:hypothetical protein